jgi:dTDP-4-amino-4,6-dideoxygalactose transaminase
MAYDINKILSEYGDNDFGFTTVDEAEYEAVIAERDETVEEYKQRLEQVEKIIMPFLTNLYKSRSQPYIHWPNRGPILESQMQKILTLTRG